jgi:transcriptional regulator with XRE-family HTH domain
LEITKAFSLTLLRIRKEKNFTHEKLAELAGLHPTTLSLLERNKRQPSITTVFRLADGLGIEPDEFIREVERTRAKLRKYPK